jgi:hypothetical protein
MRITLRSVGGFTGPAGPETFSVDLDALPTQKAAALRNLVEAARFFSLGPTFLKQAPRSWDFVHELSIEHGGRLTTVKFHDEAAPPELLALANAVRSAG